MKKNKKRLGKELKRAGPSYRGKNISLAREYSDLTSDLQKKSIIAETDIITATRTAIDYLQSGNPEQAEQMFRDILRVDPNNVSALHFMGLIFYKQKKYDFSIQYINKALQFGPDYADAYNNLGIVLQEIGRIDEAITCYQKALVLNPKFDRAHHNLGSALKEKWLIDDAVLHYREAIRINPYLPETFNNIGLALQDQGKLDEAESNYRRALQMRPDFPLCYSNLLLLMNYNSRHEPQSVFREHLRFAKQIAEPLYPASMNYSNDRSPSRRLKIGYVSPDFRKHSVYYFIEPVIISHNHESFEVYCYSDVLVPDNETVKLQRYADQWRNIAGIPDDKVADLIRNDCIDILIDLAGHTGSNRMLLFAQKPAPVQVSWLGYPNTTGLSTMDYRIVDSRTDPPGMTDPFYTEKLIRMPESFLCYKPDPDSPTVKELPALKYGHITFGSFNYFSKVTRETTVLWATIMKEIPGSRIILKSRNFSDKTSRKYALDMFTKYGIDAGRIYLMSSIPSFTEHLDTYGHIDIALDTFPYNGTTTTCEALWMGVPVVTLAGTIHASRVGASLLSNSGLDEFVAGSPDEYIDTAVGLARDTVRLRSLRRKLRDIMAISPLTNAEYFIRHLENSYRTIWEKWCNTGS